MCENDAIMSIKLFYFRIQDIVSAQDTNGNSWCYYHLGLQVTERTAYIKQGKVYLGLPESTGGDGHQSWA